MPSAQNRHVIHTQFAGDGMLSKELHVHIFPAEASTKSKQSKLVRIYTDTDNLPHTHNREQGLILYSENLHRY